MEILFHVLPDIFLRSDIMLGREVLSNGYCVNMTATNFSLSRPSIVNTCNIPVVSAPVNDLQNIDTDIPETKRSELQSALEPYADFFIVGFPTTRVNTGQLEIKLIDPNRTVQRRPYRLSPEERKVMRDRVEELLRAKIIRQELFTVCEPCALSKET